MTKKRNMKKDKRILIPRDEFEEEASEGLGRLSRDEAEADLRELQARMERRVSRPRFIWLPAAAAVVMLLVASAVFVTVFRERAVKETGPALAQESVSDTAYIAMAAPIGKTESTSAGQTGETMSTPAGQIGRTAGTPEAPVTSGRAVTTVPVATDVAPVSAVMADDMYVMAEEETDRAKAADEAVIQMVAANAMEGMKSDRMTVNEVAEVVVVESLPQMAHTDKKSRMEAREEAAREAVPATGKDAAAGKDASGKDAAAGAMPATGKEAAVIRSSASPVGGWDRYQEWAARNIRYPEGIMSVVRQEVMVSFTVLADSTLTDLKTVSSPGEPFTREAFRLLREGPKWVPAVSGGKAVAEEVIVKVVFR